MTVLDNYDLRAMNTFRMKVRCAKFVEYDSVGELEKIAWDSLPKPFKHIGEGSNLLFTGDFPGTILHSRIKFVEYSALEGDDVTSTVGAGVRWDDFVQDSCLKGLWGAENLSLIPGETGAAAVQNIGAYGVEIKDIISSVSCFDLLEKCFVDFDVAECSYGYRDSFFKNCGGRYIVTSVTLRLTRKYSPRLEYKGILEALSAADNLSPDMVRDAVIRIRREKLPDPEEIGSAGSFFKNPVVEAAVFDKVAAAARHLFGNNISIPHFENPDGTVKIPAAWLIEKSGLKGARIGGAAVYDKQPLVIVNASETASPQDILDLEEKIISSVRETFGVELHPEAEHI